MTSNDAPVPAPGDRPHRRRALGRGPGAVPPAGPEAAPTPAAPGRTPAEDEAAAGPDGRPAEESTTTAPGTPSTPVHDGAVLPPGGGHGASETPPGPVPEGVMPPGHGPGTLPPAATGHGPQEPPAAATTVPDGPDLPSGRETDAEGASEARRESPGEPHAGPGVASGDRPGGAPGAVPVGAGDSGSADDGGDGRFKVRLSNFEGPFDLLLQLISKHKLDVTEVALSKVTDEFMAYIRAMGPDWDLDETTEFLVVAATLLDLKAARLLPAAEVEDEADLALLEARDLLFARLLQYRAYKQVAEIFSRRLDGEARRHPRTVGLEPQHAELLPEVVIGIGPEGFARLAVKAMQPRPRPQVYVDHIHAPLVSVREQAGVVVARLRELGEASFRLLVQDTDDTLTVVARFLALLELYREKAVALDQETALGELTVRWTGGDGDAATTVTDEFDRPPEQPKEDRKT